MKKNLFTIAFIFLLLTINIIFRGPKYESENYYNSDATYHQLLTIKAMNETPITEHKLLPIVSLANEYDKFISWGATIPDKEGNYYYTSFQPLGFITPYLFLKIFKLDVNLNNLYLFNSILLVISVFLVMYLYNTIFKFKMNTNKICIISALLYMFCTEVMHSMGIVYWNQSLFQVVFLIQSIIFLKLMQAEKHRKKFLFIIFNILCILASSTEWTGYIGNIGFIIAIITNDIEFKNKKISLSKIDFKFLLGIIISSIISSLIFVIHFLTVCNFNQFKNAMISRFFARNITSNSSLFSLIVGFKNSFGLYLIFIFLLTSFILIKKNTRKYFIKNIKLYKMPIIILLFPVCENIIMKEHAISYSFDRMKLIFFVITLVFISNIVLSEVYNKKLIEKSFLIAICLMSTINLHNYLNSPNNYIWSEKKLILNKYFVNYINKYDNSILGQVNSVRGYSNLLFERGIYEWTNIEFLSNKAIEQKKEYAILLNSIDTGWQKYYYNYAQILDLSKNIYKHVGISFVNDFYKQQENIYPNIEYCNEINFEFKELKEVLYFEKNIKSEEKINIILDFVNSKLKDWEYVIWSYDI